MISVGRWPRSAQKPTPSCSRTRRTFPRDQRDFERNAVHPRPQERLQQRGQHRERQIQPHRRGAARLVQNQKTGGNACERCPEGTLGTS